VCLLVLLKRNMSRCTVTCHDARSQVTMHGHMSRCTVTCHDARSHVTMHGHTSRCTVKCHDARSHVTMRGHMNVTYTGVYSQKIKCEFNCIPLHVFMAAREMSDDQMLQVYWDTQSATSFWNSLWMFCRTITGLWTGNILPSHFASRTFHISDIAPGSPITRFTAQHAMLFLQRRDVEAQQDLHEPIYMNRFTWTDLHEPIYMNRFTWTDLHEPISAHGPISSCFKDILATLVTLVTLATLATLATLVTLATFVNCILELFDDVTSSLTHSFHVS